MVMVGMATLVVTRGNNLMKNDVIKEVNDELTFAAGAPGSRPDAPPSP
jgi:hypothetical protein